MNTQIWQKYDINPKTIINVNNAKLAQIKVTAKAVLTWKTGATSFVLFRTSVYWREHLFTQFMAGNQETSVN